MAFSQVAAELAAATGFVLATANAPLRNGPGGRGARVRGESETRSPSAVDEGEIRWTEVSKYDSRRTHAVTEWNRVIDQLLTEGTTHGS